MKASRQVPCARALFRDHLLRARSPYARALFRDHLLRARSCSAAGGRRPVLSHCARRAWRPYAGINARPGGAPPLAGQHGAY